MRFRTFEESIDFLNRFYLEPQRPKVEVGLARMRVLLGLLGDPHRSFRSVHVTGSGGKSSTTTMIASVLTAAGYRTGLFRSPHLTSYPERIGIDQEDISPATWLRLLNELMPLVEAMWQGDLPGYDLGRPAWFELLFALACSYFREMGVQWAAVEVGIGGRLDATNVLEPDVASVTNVTLEHTNLLGPTVAAIAAEKAAIIKPGAHAVTASQDPEALTVIEARAEEVGAPLLRVGPDIDAHVVEAGLERQTIALRGCGTALDVSLAAAGEFQVLNAATAYAMAVCLRQRGVAVPDRAVHRAFERVRLPGRFEMASRNPIVILDGAHNPAEMASLRRTVEDVLPARRPVVVFAAMADKDLASMAGEIGAISRAVIVTRAPGTSRGADPQMLAAHFLGWTDSLMLEDDAERALELARSLAGPDGVVLVTGSLYLVGHLRAARTPVGVDR